MVVATVKRVIHVCKLVLQFFGLTLQQAAMSDQPDDSLCVWEGLDSPTTVRY